MRQIVWWVLTGVDPATGERETPWSPCWFALLSVRYAVFIFGTQIVAYTALVVFGS